ncbi:MAG TPA: CdaR family protein [Caldisericia bacterium]|nr:CdaR family protein [Caldisericia bacterium]HPF48150.1 CdaR family protein [Caldisericia bacterium]HPI83914.1 CdaR family protein [Caldisericia bacterium]HPQ92603.1 CdaR family protein [Caldisericia bacterium]HRV74299.1 CdaR family protein [Caldisericia bacterium]
MVRQTLGSNLGIKILAVLIAIVIWIYVFYQEGPEREKSFEIQVIASNKPQQMVLMNDLPVAKIWLRGSEIVLNRITQDNITAFIDLMDLEAGTHQVEINVGFPQTVVLASVTPDVLSVSLQKEATAELNIKYDYIGQPEPGITLSDPVLDPQKVVVTGPESYISMLDYAKVTIDRDGMTEGPNAIRSEIYFVTNTDELLVPIKIQSMKLTPQIRYINATLTGTLKSDTKNVQTRVKTTGNIPPGYEVSIDWIPKLVTVEGDFNAIAGTSVLETTPLNLNGIVASSRYTLDLVVPTGVNVVSSSRVTVNVTVEPIAEKILKSIEVDVTPNNVLYSLNRNRVDLRIRGPKEAIDSVVSASVSIDITGLSSGTHQLPVKISGLPNSVYVVETPVVEIVLP